MTTARTWLLRSASLAALVLVVWLLAPGEAQPGPSSSSSSPPPASERVLPTPRPAAPVVPSTEVIDEGPPLPQAGTQSRRCRPARPRDGQAPLELELTGAPAEAARSVRLELAWREDVKHRHFVVLRDWRATLWPCSPETEVRITEGAWRLPSTLVPSSGLVRLALSPAPPRRRVSVVTRDLRGAPVDGVSLRLGGCERAVSADGGVAQTECDELATARPASASKPWRLSVETVPGDATSLELLVLGEEEVEPGKVGLGFAEEGGALIILAIAKRGPAARAGLRLGDELLEVDGFGVRTEDEARARIVGAPGVPVRLKVRRGVDVLLLDVTRQ